MSATVVCPGLKDKKAPSGTKQIDEKAEGIVAVIIGYYYIACCRHGRRYLMEPFPFQEGPGLCPRTPVGPAGYGLAAGGGWRTLWCRQGRTVGGSGFLGWAQCRSGRRISDGRVWRKMVIDR
eukprot:scaffold10312_cov141-Skeletonema_marinoi.AAC.10